MRPTRQALIIGSAVWAVVGALVAISAVPDVNPDARWLVGIAAGLGLTLAPSSLDRSPAPPRESS
jgi:hypothetical protein